MLTDVPRQILPSQTELFILLTPRNLPSAFFITSTAPGIRKPHSRRNFSNRRITSGSIGDCKSTKTDESSSFLPWRDIDELERCISLPIPSGDMGAGGTGRPLGEVVHTYVCLCNCWDDLHDLKNDSSPGKPLPEAGDGS